MGKVTLIMGKVTITMTLLGGVIAATLAGVVVGIGSLGLLLLGQAIAQHLL